MKVKKITRETDINEWVGLDACDKCKCINSSTMFKIIIGVNRKALLCDDCLKELQHKIKEVLEY